KNLALIKVFLVGNDFDFNILEKYEPLVNYFLFDTKGIEKGGNGIQFNWQLLDQYPSKKPYFLSGGIGLESLADLKLFLQSPASKYCWAIDVNSRFETIPGLKVIDKLKEFKHYLV
ncbi:MAG: N-(5'-phosphoribosyl)anthranilate isomerase, partial [Flavobacteriales bacterium CG_4_8_14_3_um_filter_35_10]